MLPIAEKWAEMPPVAKKAIVFLLAGWVAHYLFYFGFISESQPERVTYLNLGVGIGICYCVIIAKKWARRLCIYFNLIMVAMYGLFAMALAMGEKFDLFLLTAAAAVFFGLSLYWLLQKDTARFFSSFDKENEQNAAEEPAGSPGQDKPKP